MTGMSDDLDITVVIPTIPPRAHLLQRAVSSVLMQTLRPKAIIIQQDIDHEGAWVTRDLGLQAVRTPLVAFLDDDDAFKPNHLAMLAAAVEDGADYAWSYYELIGSSGESYGDEDPILGHFGRQFDPANPHQTTITVLVRTEIAQSVGFRPPPGLGSVDGQRYGEDFAFTLGCLSAGARFCHVPARTWYWHHHGRGEPGMIGNTSGLPDRW